MAFIHFNSLAEDGCSTYCNMISKLCASTDNVNKNIEKYFQTLFEKDKSQTVFEAYINFLVRLKKFSNAKEIFIEAQKVNNITPIDLSTYRNAIINHIVYNDKNPFEKDSCTNIYINKLNNPIFNKIGDCDICHQENVMLIPFDCTHFVCAYNCYPRIMINIRKKCPICRIDFNYNQISKGKRSRYDY